jgi:hypothetical protein
MKNAIIIGVLLGATISTQLLAGEGQACIQRNRLQSWRALDENTLQMTDKQMNNYNVTFRAPCRGLADSRVTLVFGRAWSNLGCLSAGMPINVSAAGRGLATCRVASVTAASGGDQGNGGGNASGDQASAPGR